MNGILGDEGNGVGEALAKRQEEEAAGWSSRLRGKRGGEEGQSSSKEEEGNGKVDCSDVGGGSAGGGVGGGPVGPGRGGARWSEGLRSSKGVARGAGG